MCDARARRSPLLPILLLSVALAEPWRTVDTEHFRVHYPAEAEAWALQAAGTLEETRARVVEEVGYAPERRVTVVVDDPYGQANGMALPRLGRPVMVLWASPPPPESVIGHYRDWSELLLVHEGAHLAHLLRPSRHPLRRALGPLIPYGPVALRAPRWVAEGYATVVEGRLTGWGRPHSDLRATLLRALAQEGALPGYAQLNGAAGWMGGSWAYLVGSAYLEWLEERAGPGSLRQLWRAMSARDARPFDESFRDVFGDTPEALYARFTAELTHDALEAEARRPPRDDTLLMPLERSTGAPALSPDGGRLAAVMDRALAPPVLVTWSTADPAEAREDFEEQARERLEADPEDVPPRPPDAFPLEELDRRHRPDRPADGPRWMPDGEGLLFAAWTPDAEGRLAPDLFLRQGARERRITRGAGVRDADPHPDGTWAIAVQQRWGATGLVRVDLATGAVTPLTDARVDEVVHAPRISPDGQRVAFLRNQDGWQLVVRSLGDGAEQVLNTPPWALLATPSWDPAGDAVLVTLGTGGALEAARVPLDSGPPVFLTATRGGALAPLSDGATLTFLSLDAGGFDLHRQPLDGEAPAPDLGDDLPVVLRPPPPEAPPRPAPAPLTPGRYRPGPPELRLALGGLTAPGQGELTVGVILGEPSGRDALLLEWVDAGKAGSGWAAAGRRDRGPWQLRAGTRGVVGPEGRLSAEASARRVAWDGDLYATLEAGTWADRPLGASALPARLSGYAWGGASRRLYLGGAWLGLEASGAAQGGWTGGAPRGVVRGDAGLRLGWGLASLGGSVGGGLAAADLDADRFTPGGFASAAAPEAEALGRLGVPGFAPGTLVGDDLLSWTADLRPVDPIALAFSRHRVGDQAASLVSLRLQGLTPAGSVLLGANGALDAGVGCVLETPGDARTEAPCTRLADWTAWFGLRWLP